MSKLVYMGMIFLGLGIFALGVGGSIIGIHAIANWAWTESHTYWAILTVLSGFGLGAAGFGLFVSGMAKTQKNIMQNKFFWEE